eukprot:728288-Prymnesium_polylepis.1
MASCASNLRAPPPSRCAAGARPLRPRTTAVVRRGRARWRAARDGVRGGAGARRTARRARRVACAAQGRRRCGRA